MIVLDAAEVEARLPYDRLVPALRSGLAAHCEAPPRAHHDLGDGAAMLLMPAWTKRDAGLKLVNIFPANAERGASPISSAYILCDGTTGEMRALIDGHALTTRRTAAVAALGADYLAPEWAGHLLLVGAGHVARELPAAMAAVRPIRKVSVWARDPAKAAALAAELQDEGFAAAPCDDLERGVGEASIVACATFAREPIVRGEWLRADGHLCLIGGFRPDMHEADGEAVRRSFVVADTRAGVLAEAGDILSPIAAGLIDGGHVRADLFDLVRSGVEVPSGMPTLFKSVGHAAQDLAASLLCVAGAAA